VSTSPTFYTQLFSAKDSCATFCTLSSGSIFFGAKYGLKSALKLLVKLTISVNFTNILLAAFLYESFARSFFVLTLAKEYWYKCAYKMLVKLNTGRLKEFQSIAKLKISEISGEMNDCSP
jgi:hypothetical protein